MTDATAARQDLAATLLGVLRAGEPEQMKADARGVSALADAIEAARTDVVAPFAIDPATVSPVIASVARSWHDALSEGEREALLLPKLPKLAGTRGSAAVEERRAVMTADWLVRCYLPNWLHGAGLKAQADLLGLAPEFTSLPALLLLRPTIEGFAQSAHAAWLEARARVKADVSPDMWRPLLEEVRDTVREAVQANAEAAVRTPIEDLEWSRIEFLIWSAVEASIWAIAWTGLRLVQGDSAKARITAALAPFPAGLARFAMGLIGRLAAVGQSRPLQAFFDLGDFPQLVELAASWQVIRDEAATLHAPVMEVDRTDQTYDQTLTTVVQQIDAGAAYGWVKGWGAPGGNRDWTQYGIILGYRPVPFAAAPRTLALLSGIEGIKVAAFVRLAPSTLLPLHTHPELEAQGLIQMHLTLKAPPNFAYLNVAGQFRQHVPGSAFVFDGTLDHFAVNASDEERVILYLEFAKAAHHRPVTAAMGH